MKRIYFLWLLISTVSFSQTITVDNTTNSPTQLVNLLLGNSCVEVSNISISSNQSVGYFNRNGSTFPINEGIILRTGNILNTQGLFNDTNISTPAAGGGTDTFLQNLSNTSSGTTFPLTDLSYIQFDFVPISSSFSFDFLFASNEYGAEQCRSNDIFAFELTNIATGVTTNLGVIPGTSNPVTVKNIKDMAYNASCTSTNPALFSVYNVINPPASTLNMRGHTVVLNASSTVVPNTAYRLKLVIADYGDTQYDSSVFISGGSFTNTLNLGPDQTICSGNSVILDTQLDNTYAYQWTHNGNPIGGNTPTLTVTAPGTYVVTITKGACVLTDTVVFNDLTVTNPVNLQTCNTGAANYTFNLTANNETQLGINTTTYDVFYYDSLANANADIRIPTPTIFSTTATGQTIFIKIFNTLTNEFCDAVYTFNLLISATVTATQPANEALCLNDAPFNLSTLNPQVLNGQAGYNVSYYTFEADAIAGNGAVISSVSPLASPGTQVVWIRMEDQNNPSCFDITSVTITTHPLPLVDTLTEVVECSNYTLPALTNGNYFTGPGGTGTPLFAGDIIDVSATYYIYNGPDANGCFNESSFNAYFIDEYTPTLDNCGSFTIPVPPFNIGAFYTAAGGPNGAGSLIPEGTTYTNSSQTSMVQTIFYYAEVNGVFCRDEQFDINIHGMPLIESKDDYTGCDSFVLPPITAGFGSYNTASNGSGTSLNPGDIISVNGPNFPGTYYVVNALPYVDVLGNNSACADNDPFTVNLVDTSLFTTVTGCGSYTLPAIPFGGYFTAPMGGGTAIDPNIPITTNQVVYYYTNTTVLPNCTDNLNYNIIINPLPAVDLIPSGPHCGSFTLPTLTNGNYYTLPGGPSTPGQIPLNAGQIIDLTGNNLAPGTYYIYGGPDANSCTFEWPFTISITPLPIVDEYISREECNPYSIPTPTIGQIYTEPNGPNGSGVVVTSTEIFNTSNDFYVYYQDPITGCIADKKFEINYIGINLPNFNPVNVCTSYVLPALTHVPENIGLTYTIGYFYDAAGLLPVPNGTVFLPTTTPVTIYVIAVNTVRFDLSCTETKSFTITVSDIPVIPAMVFPTSACGTYTLPTLPTVPYTIGYFSSPNGVGPITNLDIVNNTGTPGNMPAISQTYTYYVYATAPNNSGCNDQEVFTFTVHPLLNLPITDGIICVDPITNEVIDSYTIHTGLNPAQFTVNWYLNNVLVGTGVSFTATQAGTYRVEFIKLIPDVGNNCGYNDSTFEVIASSPAVANFTVSQEFDTNNAFITVNITNGLGNYLFQLEYPDGSTTAFETSNTFSNLETGEYFVNIYDTLGNCSPTRIGPIYIVNYPNFFTPNGDGVNDRWNIFDLAQQPNSVISIFDRYGKFLKQISPSESGWDGKYNNQELPSTDYWFTVEYISQQGNKAIFKSHFTLKR